MSELKNRIASFKWAFNGFKILYSEETNAKIHLIATVIVVCLGIFFEISRYEWIAILIVVGMVISAEIINTSIEHLADFVSKEKRPAIKKVKDLAAAAVLFNAIIAALVGIIIFGSRLINYF